MSSELIDQFRSPNWTFWVAFNTRKQAINGRGGTLLWALIKFLTFDYLDVDIIILPMFSLKILCSLWNFLLALKLCCYYFLNLICEYLVCVKGTYCFPHLLSFLASVLKDLMDVIATSLTHSTASFLRIRQRLMFPALRLFSHPPLFPHFLAKQTSHMKELRNYELTDRPFPFISARGYGKIIRQKRVSRSCATIHPRCAEFELGDTWLIQEKFLKEGIFFVLPMPSMLQITTLCVDKWRLQLGTYTEKGEKKKATLFLDEVFCIV